MFDGLGCMFYLSIIFLFLYRFGRGLVDIIVGCNTTAGCSIMNSPRKIHFRPPPTITTSSRCSRTIIITAINAPWFSTSSSSTPNIFVFIYFVFYYYFFTTAAHFMLFDPLSFSFYLTNTAVCSAWNRLKC